MKRIPKLITTAVLGVAFMATSVIALAGEVSFGAAGAAIDESLTLKEILTYAIQDEYMAQGEYEAIMDEYGVQKPFSNIVKTEGRHISMLLPLFDKIVVDGAEEAYHPEDIKGSYTFGEVSELFDIPLEDMVAAFDLPKEIDAAAFKNKELETIYADQELEVGTGSVRLFVSFYKGLPYELTEETYLLSNAVEILKEKANLTQEQIDYLDSHIATISN